MLTSGCADPQQTPWAVLNHSRSHEIFTGTCGAVLLIEWSLFRAVDKGTGRGNDFLKVRQLEAANVALIPAAAFIELFLYAVTCMQYRALTTTLRGGGLLLSHFIDKETEAQRSQGTCPKSHSSIFLPSDPIPSTQRWNWGLLRKGPASQEWVHGPH